MENKTKTAVPWLDYLWKYFEIHASQRMKTFNFFIIFASLLTAGLVNSFKIPNNFPVLSFCIGLALLLISIIFWQLDKRVKFLIKHGEGFLIDFEKKFPFQDSGEISQFIEVFFKEKQLTDKIKNDGKKWCKFSYFTYSKCFNYVFSIFMVIGILGVVLGLVNLFSSPN